MYDPIRKNLREYFESGRDESVLARVRETIAKHPSENKFDDAYKRSNSRALTNLANLDFRGTFTDVQRYNASIVVAGLQVKSSIDFVASFQGSDSRSKTKCVGVIINPSGIRRGNPNAQKRFARIEIEFCLRMLESDRSNVDECWYVDLPKESVVEKRGTTSSHLWADIDAACERIVEDFKRYRVQQRERPSDESA
jgi:hypothetical protein